MKITRANYESFFLDFLEGNLEEKNMDKFLDFMEQNPDLKEELQRLKNVFLPDEKIIFPEKKQLYKSEADKIVSPVNMIVAYLEDDLENEERKAFEAYLTSHPELQKDFNLFTKTRLIPDTGIKYPDKQKLHKKSGYTILTNWVARVAAVIVLLWGINTLFQNRNQTEPLKSNQEIVEIRPTIKPPVKKTEPEKKSTGTEVQEKLKTTYATKTTKPTNIRELANGQLEKKHPGNSKPTNNGLTTLAKITPILARLEVEPSENQLTILRTINADKINDQRNIMTLDEFMASRVKKAGDEGLLSAQRIVRAGLSVASELSGERIGYSVKNGKIASLDFESKLLAFSIPLKKK